MKKPTAAQVSRLVVLTGFAALGALFLSGNLRSSHSAPKTSSRGSHWPDGVANGPTASLVISDPLRAQPSDFDTILEASEPSERAAALERVLAEIGKLDAGAARQRYLALVDWLAQESGDYALVQAAIDRVADSDFQAYLLSCAVSQLAKAAPAKTGAWLLTLPDTMDRSAALEQLGRLWAETDPAGASDYALQLGDQALRLKMLNATMDVWIAQNPAAAGAWLDARDPGPELDHAIAEISRLPAVVEDHAALALNWAECISSVQARKQSISIIVHAWAEKDRPAAANYLRNTTALPAFDRDSILDEIGAGESANP